MKKIILLTVCSLLLIGCSQKQTEQEEVTEIQVENVKEKEEALNSEISNETEERKPKEELTKEMAYEILDPFNIWIREQSEPFSGLTDTQKAEIVASSILANDENVSSIPYEITRDHFMSIMELYFGTANFDVNNVTNTDLITVSNDKILYFLGDSEGNLQCEILSIDSLDYENYKVSVAYYMEVGALSISPKQQFASATYEFTYDYEQECYFISECQYEYIYSQDGMNENVANFKEELRNIIVEHYTKAWNPKGTYVSFDRDDYGESPLFGFVIRYQMSDEEVEEKLQNGGFVAANIYVTSIDVNIYTGEVTEEWGSESWNIESEIK